MYNTNYEEQETIVNIDYSKSILSIYTNRKATYKKLLSKIGESNDTFYIKDKICGGTWNIPFSEKKILTSILSRPLLIGNVK